MSVFSEPDGFTKINQTSKPNPKDGANSSSVITVDSVKTTDDQEIAFASIASRNKTSGTMDGLSVEETSRLAAWLTFRSLQQFVRNLAFLARSGNKMSLFGYLY